MNTNLLENVNTNLLENMACPKCGQSEQFKIVVTAVATVVDDGVLEAVDSQWSADAYAECDGDTDCDWIGTAGELELDNINREEEK